jgi:tetratricopeptide (TPR) repeat protein
MLWLLPCYFLIRPLSTLLPELCRAICMLTWSRRHMVDVHLGSQGHDLGLSFRLGRLNFRIHAYFFLLRGGISDTLTTPSTRQYLAWNISGLICSFVLLVFALTLILLRSLPDEFLPLLGMGALLSLTDLGFGLFRETDPICMRCGLVHTGSGPALRILAQYRSAAIDFLRGVRHYLRDDYRAAVAAYQRVLAAGMESEELLEDLQYAQMALGDYPAAAATFARLEARYVPSATQLAIASYVHWRLGQPGQAFARADAAIRTASAQPVARNYRAWLHLESGHPQAALTDLDIAIESSAEYATAYANRARAHIALGQVEAAERDILDALRLDPLDLETLGVGIAFFTSTGALAQAAALRARHDLISHRQPPAIPS